MANAAAPPAAPAADPWVGDQNQWEITWYPPNPPDGPPNDEPVVYIVRRFANAWGQAQPPAPEDEPGWTYTRRADVWPALSQGQTVSIAWRADNGAFVTLKRM
jgi:hypothetical protein